MLQFCSVRLVHTQKIQKQKSHAADDEHADVLVRHKVLQHEIRQNRIQHTDDGDEQGGDHVQNEHFLMRLVIGNKSFQHEIVLSFLIRYIPIVPNIRKKVKIKRAVQARFGVLVKNTPKTAKNRGKIPLPFRI